MTKENKMKPRANICSKKDIFSTNHPNLGNILQNFKDSLAKFSEIFLYFLVLNEIL